MVAAARPPGTGPGHLGQYRHQRVEIPSDGLGEAEAVRTRADCGDRLAAAFFETKDFGADIVDAPLKRDRQRLQVPGPSLSNSPSSTGSTPERTARAPSS